VGDEGLFENKYRIGELLGRGGMGVVHAAVNVFSEADVAIKRIPREVVERHALHERMRRESKVLALVIHPNIVRLLDCGATQDGDLYIVMERVDGDPLRALMRRAAKKKETLELSRVLLAVIQIADAMDLAHRKGIYHRDLKPENIMICEGGHAKVLDFGLAKTPSTGPTTAPSPTNPTSVIGTPKYMAPEQVRGLPVDGRTDIFGLGVVLYEAISGHTPFDSEEDEASTLTEIMGHQVFADPRPLRELVPGCPDDVWNAVLRCLAKRPQDRFSSMSELARVLRRCEANEATRKAVKGVSAQRREDGFSGREVRVTEPMPESFQPGDMMPFAPSSFLRTAQSLRGMRVTEPMPAPTQPRRPISDPGPPAAQLLGKGHTLQLPRGSFMATAVAEPVASLGALVPEAQLASKDAQENPRDGGDGSTRSGPGFAFEPTWPDNTTKIASPLAVEASTKAPTQNAPTPTAKAHARKTSPMKTPSLWVALPGGFALATFSLVATMIARTPHQGAERPIDPTPAVEVQPSATPSAPEPVAWASTPEPGPSAPASAPLASAPVPAVIAAVTSAPAATHAPPASTSTVAPRPAQRRSPPVAPVAPAAQPQNPVVLFQLPSEKVPASQRRASGVTK
jgi:serine/threonine protein kinase